MDDIGGSRIRALLADGTLLGDVDCLVVVAGLDASLATMIGAMTDVPVVAVPTSTGQPSAFGGLGALMTMLNSAAPGVVVSNIDNGYSAGVFAARVARRPRAEPPQLIIVGWLPRRRVGQPHADDQLPLRLG